MTHWQLSFIIASIFIARAIDEKLAWLVGVIWACAASFAMTHAFLNSL